MAETNVASTAVTPPPVVPAPQPDTRQPAKVTTTQQFSEQQVEQIVTRVLDRVIAPFRQEVASERSVRQQREQEARHGLIRSFCERMVKEGRLSPAQVEMGRDGKPVGPQAKALFAADAVRKFSDGKTALELQMEALEAQPVRRFSEQVQDPIKGAHQDAVDQAKAYAARRNGKGSQATPSH